MTNLATATAELETEHHTILKVVSAMAALEHDLLEGRGADIEALKEVIDFMRNYGDILHHGKEEQLLFTALEDKGISVKGCPIGTLLAEHEQGRRLVNALDSAVQEYESTVEGRDQAIAKALGDLVKLYPAHIWKEDFLAFPMSEKIFSSDEKASLASQYSAVNTRIGQDEISRLEMLADTLMRLHENS